MSYFHESSDVEIKEKVVKIFGKTLESFEKDVEDVRVWLKTQPHLPQVLSKYFFGKNGTVSVGNYIFFQPSDRLRVI